MRYFTEKLSEKNENKKKKQKNIDQNSYLYQKCVIAATFYFNKDR